jgi:EmrB/QacA subfamily drug resistance transporter
MSLSSPSHQVRLDRRSRRVAMSILLLASFMNLLDVTIVNVALPSIADDISATPSELQWTLSAYTLAFALTMITGARLGDILGRKRVFMTGVAGFVVASALCGFATGPAMLIGTRILQGIFAALMVPQVLSQIQVMFAPHERGGPMAAFSAMTGLAATTGPLLGAALVEFSPWGLSWRMIFWINVPVGLIAIALSLRHLPESRTQHTSHLDAAGVLLSALGLMLLLHPLTAGNRLGLTLWDCLSLGAGVITLAGFTYHQRMLERNERAPLLEVSLLRLRSIQGGLLVVLLFTAAITGFFLVVMQFLQLGVGVTPMAAGFTVLPWSVALSILAGISAAVLLPRISRAVVQIGILVTAAGFAFLALVAVHATADTSWVDMLGGVLLGGAGMGMVVSPLAQLTLADVPVRQAGSGSALFNTVNQVAASLGVAVIGTFFFARLSPSVGTPQPSAHTYGTALSITLWFSILLMALALVSSFLLPRRTSASTHTE